MLPTDVMLHGARPKADTLEDQVAVKKLLLSVIAIDVEAVVTVSIG